MMKKYRSSKVFCHILFAFLWLAAGNAATQIFAQPPAAQSAAQAEVKINPAIFDQYVGQYEDAEAADGVAIG